MFQFCYFEAMTPQLQVQLITSLGVVLSTTLPALIAAIVVFRIYRTRKLEHELTVAMKDILVLRKIYDEYSLRFKEVNPEGSSEARLVKDAAELELGIELSSKFTPSAIRTRMLNHKLDQALIESVEKSFKMKI
jgi:hypothetical protein